MSEQVTVDEICFRLDAGYYANSTDHRNANLRLIDRIKQHGIAPPDGYAWVKSTIWKDHVQALTAGGFVLPDGMCIVPIEPTQAMIEAGQDISKNTAWTYSGCYKAMLEAYIKETK